MAWGLHLTRMAKLLRSAVIEVTGLWLLTTGVHQVYEPAAFIFAGAALVVLAQGMERDE